MGYFEQLKKSCEWLAERDNTIFLGQAVSCKGHAISRQLVDIDPAKRYELPVAENMQAGIALGLSLQGYVPVSIYPRWNFFLLAADQIVNHLDKWEAMDCGAAKVIIKVGTPARYPLDAGEQHSADFSAAFEQMCPHIKLIRLVNEKDIQPAYEMAYYKEGSFILVEYSELY